MAARSYVVALADGRYLGRQAVGNVARVTGPFAFASTFQDIGQAERWSRDFDGHTDQPSVVAEIRNDWRSGCGAEPYRILVGWHAHPLAGDGEEYRLYWATTFAEALTMAERDGSSEEYPPDCYGVHPCQYDRARAEGIRFNEADGLLL